MSSDDLMDLHRSHAWQPFTQMKLAPDPVIINRAEGVFLYTEDGKKIIDAVGSWWVNIHGHNNPYINNAMKTQLEKFEHVIYAGFTHEGAIQLSSELSKTTQGHLPRVFFSDNGSTAVEVALKMAYQYFVNSGRLEKNKFAALAGGYHGDTMGAMSAGARSVFHEAFNPLLFPVHYASFPEIPFSLQSDDSECDKFLKPAYESLEKLFGEHGRSLCGFILEPLLQGAGGMRIYPEKYLHRVRDLCSEYEVFLIADEVFTGIGRTGSMYACERAGIWPDLMCLSKGLSGGYLPFAATLATEKIFQGFNSENRNHTLFHGHSMTGSALGCAASIASLDLMSDKNRLNDVKRIENFHRTHLDKINTGKLKDKILETRFIGSVGVVEFDLKQKYTGNFGWDFQKKSIEKGVLLRTLGPVVYMAPPYIMTDHELEIVYECLESAALELLT